MKRTEKIPPQIQTQLDAIKNAKLHLAKLPVPEHPKLSSFNQFFVVWGVVIDLKNKYIKINFDRQLEDKETNEINTHIKLEAPSWVITEESLTGFLDQQFKQVQIPVDYTQLNEETEEEELIETKREDLDVNTIQYLSFLLQNNAIGFYDLITFYAADFIEKNANILNQ